MKGAEQGLGKRSKSCSLKVTELLAQQVGQGPTCLELGGVGQCLLWEEPISWSAAGSGSPKPHFSV